MRVGTREVYASLCNGEKVGTPTYVHMRGLVYNPIEVYGVFR